MDKWTTAEYEKVIVQRRQEAHDKLWLYIELNAQDLMDELNSGGKDYNLLVKAMQMAMLEGDRYIQEPNGGNSSLKKTTIRYYVDNLSPWRKKCFDLSSFYQDRFLENK